MDPTGHLINTQTDEYPRSLWQLRMENPNTSFPAKPDDQDLIPFHHANVFAAAPPELDFRTQCLESAARPHLSEGRYVLGWVVRDRTEEELQQYEDANRPSPDWAGFTVSLISHPLVSMWFNALPQIVAATLSATLADAAKGQPDLFAAIWKLTAQSAPPTVVNAVLEMAQLHQLPAEIVALLSVHAENSHAPDWG